MKIAKHIGKTNLAGLELSNPKYYVSSVASSVYLHRVLRRVKKGTPIIPFVLGTALLQMPTAVNKHDFEQINDQFVY